MNSRKSLANFILVISALMTGPVAHAADELLPSVTSSVTLWDSAGHNPGTAGFTNSSPQWYAFQWGNPTSLAPQTFSPTSSWQINNQYSRIEYYSSLNGHSNVYELASANVPCKPDQSAKEQDLFLQTPAGTNLNTPLMAVPLTSIGQLFLTAGLTVAYDTKSQLCSDNNVSTHIVSVILKTNTQPQQTLYVQIDLASTDPILSTIRWCDSYENSYDSQFCLDDSVVNYGGSVVGTYVDYKNSIDILPRLLYLIQTGHSKRGTAVALVTDPSQWILQTLYFGMVNFGGEIATTQWYDLSLKSLGGGTFCNGGSKTQWVCETPLDSGWTWVGGSCYQRVTSLSC